MASVSAYESSSSSSSSSDSDHDELPPNRRKQARNWTFEKRFENGEEARDFIDSENTWSIVDRNPSLEGRRVYYRCNKVKRRGIQCAASVHLLYDSLSLDVLLYRIKSEHTCTEIQQVTQRLSSEMKAEMDILLEMKQKPKRIFEILHEKKFTPTITQVRNYCADWRRKKFGPSTISLGELEQWCLDHQTSPESEDDSYVIGHCIKYGDVPSFQVVISTKRLLRHATQVKHIHCDATYKVVWEGMPVMIVGTSDLDRVFHPICISVCSDEQKSSFKFIFETLKKSSSMKPVHLISDAACAIREAFREVFGHKSKLGMCWSYTRRAIDKKMHLVSKDNRKKVMSDIENLQICPDCPTFNKARKLFIKKWANQEKEFIEYLEGQWLTTHDGWHEGFGWFWFPMNKSNKYCKENRPISMNSKKDLLQFGL